jgi:hypothetical protein
MCGGLRKTHRAEQDTRNRSGWLTFNMAAVAPPVAKCLVRTDLLLLIAVWYEGPRYKRSQRRTVLVRINDRGPYGRGRIIDLSRAAARELDMIRFGTTRVNVVRQ